MRDTDVIGGNRVPEIAHPTHNSILTFFRRSRTCVTTHQYNNHVKFHIEVQRTAYQELDPETVQFGSAAAVRGVSTR